MRCIKGHIYDNKYGDKCPVCSALRGDEPATANKNISAYYDEVRLRERDTRRIAPEKVTAPSAYDLRGDALGIVGDSSDKASASEESAILSAKDEIHAKASATQISREDLRGDALGIGAPSVSSPANEGNAKASAVPAETENSVVHLPLHTVLNKRYTIIQQAGYRGHSTFYLARDNRRNCLVFVEELFPSESGKVYREKGKTQVHTIEDIEEYRERFRKETEAFVILQNSSIKQNIFPVLDVFEEYGTLYRVTEIDNKKNVREFYDAVTGENAVEEVVKLARLVAEVHKQGIVLNCICPEGLDIKGDGTLVLRDLSYATIGLSEPLVRCNSPYVPSVEKTDIPAGDPRRDVYSVAAVLFNLLTGEEPPEEISHVNGIEKAFNKKKKIPGYVISAIVRAMRPYSRNSIKDMDELAQCLQGRAIKDKKQKIQRRLKAGKFFRNMGVALLVVSLILAGMGIYDSFDKVDIIPDEATTITLWYRDKGNDAENQRWEYISEDFVKFAGESRKKLSDIKLEVKAIPDDQYEALLQEAIESGENIPDIYDSMGIDSYTASLDVLYDKLNERKFCNAYNMMKNELSYRNQIAVCFDAPVLYTYTDGGDAYVPDLASGVDELIYDKEGAEGYQYSLICHPDAVLYGAYSYGSRPGENDKLLLDFYDCAKTFDGEGNYINPIDVFTSKKKGAKYLLGKMSDYSEIAQKSRAGQESFAVVPLTGDSGCTLIYPETWSISGYSDSLEQRTAMLFLYFLINTDIGQHDITRVNRNTFYMPMKKSAIENIGNQEDYIDIYNFSDASLDIGYDERCFIRENEKIISDGVKNGKEFTELALIYPVEESN